jgi:hypothetical protein
MQFSKRVILCALTSGLLTSLAPGAFAQDESEAMKKGKQPIRP